MRVVPRRAVRTESSRDGAAAIELAIVLPVMITIILGCVDFGRLANTHIAITNAARAAAGFASVKPFTSITQSAWESQLQQVALEELSDFNTQGVLVTAVRSYDDNALWRIRVTVAYPFKTTTSWPMIPNQFNLQRTVEVRGIR